jgi:F-type H+-transporting ATPase subunit a
MEVHVEVAAETLFNVGPIPVTNSMLTMFIVMGLIFLGFWLAAKSLKEVPGRWQGLLEMIVGFMMGLLEGTAGRRAARQLIWLVGGVFIFILFANFSGLLPGVGTIGFYRDEETAHEETTTQGEHEALVPVEIASTSANTVAVTSAPAEEEHDQVLVPFFRAPNADINMTLALALVTFSAVQYYGIRAHGFGGRIKHLMGPSKAIAPLMFPIEVIGEFSRIISLSARLFGNVFAGEVLMGVMVAMGSAIKIVLIPVLLPTIFLFLEVLFGSIQALVFALLTAIYITLAMAGHDDHEEEHGHAEAHEPAPATALAGSHGD